MEKRLLNIAAFARIYFAKIGKEYDEHSRKERESADKNFRRMLKQGKLDPSVLSDAMTDYLAKIQKEINSLS